MIHLINVGEGINNSSGDRGQYPDGAFYGLKSWYDLTDYEKKSYIEYNFEDKGYNDREYYLLLNSDINYIDKFEFDYTVIGLGRNPIVKKEPDKTKIDLKVKNLLYKLGFEDFNLFINKNRCGITKENYYDYLNDDAIAFINDFYNDDFELFGYKKILLSR